MGWIGKIANSWRRKRPGAGRVAVMRKSIRASYDAAQTHSDNVRHWANTDSLSADAANSASVRQVIRERARYEVQNNCWAKGILLTLANDTIGTGPRLQMQLDDPVLNSAIERAYHAWGRAARLAAKLRTMKIAKTGDGEAFAQFTTNQALKNPVKLDLRLTESDQIASTAVTMLTERDTVDGLRFDVSGNVIEYHRLKTHPGDESRFPDPSAIDRIPADDMIHLFRCDRPGQHRGVSEIVSALPLFAQLRRMTLATIAAAETAADFAAVMFTDSAAVAEPDKVDEMQAIEIEMRSMLTLPHGWRMGQFKAEHPNTTYEMFRNAILNEIARCVLVPFNVAAGNSAGYNFASGRLDHKGYFKSIQVERSVWEIDALDRIFEKWFDEAALITGLIPDGMGAVSELPHVWHWDGQEHVDPQKERKAQTEGLMSGLTTYPIEYGRNGVDWEVALQGQADSLGISLEELQSMLAAKLYGGATTSQAPASEGVSEEIKDEISNAVEEALEEATP